MKATTRIIAILATTTSIWAQQPGDQAQGDQKPLHPPVPPLFAVLDTDENGEISAEEIAAAADALPSADLNSDGVISLDEVRVHPPEKNPLLGKPIKRPPPIVQALDADQDGKLSTEEMEGAPDALKALDANGDGELTGEEMFGAPPKNEDGSKPTPPPHPKKQGHRGGKGKKPMEEQASEN